MILYIVGLFLPLLSFSLISALFFTLLAYRKVILFTFVQQIFLKDEQY